MLGLRPPGLEFRFLCLEPICAQRWPKARFISFHFSSLKIHDYSGINEFSLITIQIVFNPSDYKIELMKFRTKCVFKDQDLQLFGLKLNKYELFSPTGSFGGGHIYTYCIGLHSHIIHLVF